MWLFWIILLLKSLLRLTLSETLEMEMTSKSETTTTTTVRTTTVPQPCFNPYCKCTNENLVCEGFNSFDNLGFTQNQNYTFSRVVLKPNGMLPLNDHLDFSGLTITGLASLQLWRIQSITLGSNLFSKFNFSSFTSNKHLTLEFVESIFKFDYQKQPINSQCLSTLSENASLNVLFINVRNLNWVNVDIPEAICPYLFRNAYFQTLSFSNLSSNSKILFTDVKNEATRLNIEKTTYEFSSRIDNYIISNADLGNIDPILNVLNYDLFTRTKVITFSNVSIKSIQLETFFYFANLTTLKIQLSNWPTFLEANFNSEWMHGLNFLILSNLTSFNNINPFNLYLGSQSDTYDYPLSDFCRFADFPHFRNILPVVNFDFRGECSCTLMHILKYSMFYTTSINSDYKRSIGFQKCITGNYNQTIAHCELDKLIEKCPRTFDTTSFSELTTPRDSESTSRKSNAASISVSYQLTFAAFLIVFKLFF